MTFRTAELENPAFGKTSPRWEEVASALIVSSLVVTGLAFPTLALINAYSSQPPISDTAPRRVTHPNLLSTKVARREVSPTPQVNIVPASGKSKPADPVKIDLSRTEVEGKTFVPNPSLVLKRPDGSVIFLAVSQITKTKVIARDTWHNQLVLDQNTLKDSALTTTPEGLTMEQINQAIEKHIEFDSSLPFDRQLQFKAMVTKFIFQFEHVFPKDANGKPDIEKVLSSHLTVSLYKGSELTGGYFADQQEIVLSITRYQSDMTQFTAAYGHEFFHWIADPGFTWPGLNEGLAEAINVLLLKTTPEYIGDSLTDNSIKGCETSGEFDLHDYTRAAKALIELDATSLPGIIDLLTRQAIENKANGGVPITIEQVEKRIKRYYDKVHKKTGVGPLGEDAVAEFQEYTVLYCTVPVP